ncbi:MAG: hypothetical protein MUO82_05815 [Candidatus Thermoplasmatota archaeon]|nr:hypothetical protein [Candidatus Thermoplasmatota archaeon]
MNKYSIISILFVLFLFLNIFLSFNTKACKDIIACGDATEGDYNLLLKVRDPSRAGLQVLCFVPKDYEYDYHYPWTGKEIHYKNQHKYIGVTTVDDIIPNIVKAGMSLSDAGVSYGDSDTNSGWINPTKSAWDDFDWIRYACGQANSEGEAVDLLTKECVDKLHATGISENLFVVGPETGYVVEADAYRYKIDEITNGVLVRHNYPKLLWKSQIIKTLPISKNFDSIVEKEVRKRSIVRLGSIYGVRVTEICDEYITISPVGLYHIMRTNSLGVVTKIQIGERKTAGYLNVELLEINGDKAKIRVTNIYKGWEEEILKHINSRYGCITVRDMINWSRLTNEDLKGLRGMCQNAYEFEAVAIYKIPKNDYEIFSMGWFAPNHASSSIYIPFHICNTDIYTPYKKGDAAQLSLDLYNSYNESILASNFSIIENVFFNEIKSAEKTAKEAISKNIDISDFLTIIDTSMQKQAYITQELWKYAINKQDFQIIISDLWNNTYYDTLLKMKDAIDYLDEKDESKPYIDKINEIALDICITRINAAKSIGKDVESAENKYKNGEKFLNEKNYQTGFQNIINAFSEAEMAINNQQVETIQDLKSKNTMNYNLYFLFGVLIIVIILLFYYLIFK